MILRAVTFHPNEFQILFAGELDWIPKWIRCLWCSKLWPNIILLWVISSYMKRSLPPPLTSIHLSNPSFNPKKTQKGSRPAVCFSSIYSITKAGMVLYCRVFLFTSKSDTWNEEFIFLTFSMSGSAQPPPFKQTASIKRERQTNDVSMALFL